MTGRADLRELMNTRAADAPMPPADLVDRVEAGHRRRRRGQITAAAFTAVLVLVAGAWVGLRPDHNGALLPARPAVDLPAFKIPAKLTGTNPPIASVFPDATVGTFPLNLPGGSKITLHRRIDATHALVRDRRSFASFDTRTRTFHPITTFGPTLGNVAVSPHWVVWEQIESNSSAHFRVFKAPLSGGPAQQVADILRAPSTSAWFATDEDVYWSQVPFDGKDGGVLRLSLSSGKLTQLTGFNDVSVSGTAWAVGYDGFPGQIAGNYLGNGFRATVMRNLLTGEKRTITTASDTFALRCVPTFCLGRRNAPGKQGRPSGGYFLQHLDGSDRVELDGDREPTLVSYQDSGVLIGYGPILSVLDPLTGKIGDDLDPAGHLGCASPNTRGIGWSNQHDPDPVCNPGTHAALFN